MAERCDLTTRDQVQLGTAFYKLAVLNLDREAKRVKVVLVGENGLRKSFSYEGATAETLIIALSKTDLSAKSLPRRILERLIADGLLVGSISGMSD